MRDDSWERNTYQDYFQHHNLRFLGLSVHSFYILYFTKYCPPPSCSSVVQMAYDRPTWGPESKSNCGTESKNSNCGASCVNRMLHIVQPRNWNMQIRHSFGNQHKPSLATGNQGRALFFASPTSMKYPSEEPEEHHIPGGFPDWIKSPPVPENLPFRLRGYYVMVGYIIYWHQCEKLPSYSYVFSYFKVV